MFYETYFFFLQIGPIPDAPKILRLVVPPALPPSHFYQLYNTLWLGIGVVGMLGAWWLLRQSKLTVTILLHFCHIFYYRPRCWNVDRCRRNGESYNWTLIKWENVFNFMERKIVSDPVQSRVHWRCGIRQIAMRCDIGTS